MTKFFFSKFDISSHFKSKNYKIISKKSNSSRAFQQYQEFLAIFLIIIIIFDILKFSLTKLFNI
jgi:hypothetical protein